MSSICQSVCHSLTLLSALQSELLKARDSSPQPDTLATTPAKGMWKHAKLMTQLRPDHPASLQALQMCRRATVEEAKISAMDTHQPITISAEDQTNSASDREKDEEIMARGYQAAMQSYHDPALAMQHLLYCMMRTLLVQIPAAEHIRSAHIDYLLRLLARRHMAIIITCLDGVIRCFDVLAYIGESVTSECEAHDSSSHAAAHCPMVRHHGKNVSNTFQPC